MLKINLKTIAGLFVAFAFVVAAVAPTASAETTTTTVSASAYNYSGVMKVGTKGPGVATLQAALNSVNTTKVVVDSSFGPATCKAVKEFQTSKGLSADCVVGPMTGAALTAATVGVITVPSTGALCPNGMTLASNCMTAPSATPSVALCPNGMTLASNCMTAPSTTGPLMGGAGSVDTYDLSSSYSSEEVGESMNDVKVAGLEIEADSGSDLAITALRLAFVEVGSGNDDFEDYAKEVKIWHGSTLLATVNASEFNDDNTWTKTVTLASGAIVKAGKTETFVVTISANNTIDSADITNPNGDWTVDFTSVRFTDGQGVTTSEDPGVAATTFTFEDYASAADVELKVAISNSPASGIVAMQDNTDKDNVTLLKGTLKAVGAEVEVKDFPVTIISTGSNVSELATTFTLMIDGVEVDSKSINDGTADNYDTSVTEVLDCVGTSCTITFDDIDKKITTGSTSTFEVLVDVNEIDGTTVTQGDSLLAKATSTAVDAIDAESGSEDLAAGDLTGSATGEAQYFYTDYAQVTLVSKSFVPGTDATTDHIGTATFVVKAKAIGGTIYMNGVGETTAGKEAFQLSTLAGTVNSTLSAPAYTVSGASSNGNSVTNAGADNEYYTIAEDQEITFTITATVTQTVASTTVGVEIDSVLFGVDATDDTSRSVLPLNWTAFTDALETSQATLFV